MIWNSVVLGRWFVGCSNVQSLRDFEIEKLVQWVDGWIVNAVRTRRTRNASAGRRAMSVHAHTLAETVYCTRTEFILNTMYACNVPAMCGCRAARAYAVTVRSRRFAGRTHRRTVWRRGAERRTHGLSERNRLPNATDTIALRRSSAKELASTLAVH